MGLLNTKKMKKCNLKDRHSFFSSDELINKLKENYTGEDIVNFAYTDYGGDFFDKVAIAFFSENYPDNIVFESTVYGGQNAFIFGDIVPEFLEVTENYLLGFDNLEEFYYQMEYKETIDGFKRFIDDMEKYNNLVLCPDGFDKLMEQRSGYYNIYPSGIDFSESELIKFCINEGILIPAKNEE
jgi:hypothetical protein